MRCAIKHLQAESLLPFEIKGCAINQFYLSLLGHEKAVNEQLPNSLVWTGLHAADVKFIKPFKNKTVNGLKMKLL